MSTATGKKLTTTGVPVHCQLFGIASGCIQLVQPSPPEAAATAAGGGISITFHAQAGYVMHAAC
jgi:hypothetical protein